MKNFQFLLVALALTFCSALTITSCQKDNDEVLTATPIPAMDWRANQYSIVFPPTSHPYGNSYAEWGVEWWKWAFGFDCASNPILDPDGTFQNQNQSGPVYFLAGSTGATIVRDVTIPAGKAIFFPILNIINDYPCPDPGFQPAEGQSLEDFLTEGATGFINLVDILSVNIDGTDLTDLTAYRGTSSMFNFTGNPDLANCADPCVTGTEQQGVSDGYWIMLKPLSPGSHTLHFSGGISMYAWGVDVTYNITVN